MFFQGLKIAHRQKGQTLIETLAALFILVMGVSAAVGLAIYAFGSSTGIVKEIIATGLAREGVEAVKDMRDTNWLQDTLVVNGCYDYVTTNTNANCYKYWLGKNGSGGPPFCISPSPGNSCNGGSGSAESYFLGFDYTNSNFWVIENNNSKFGLNFDSSNAGNSGFYFPGNNNNGVSCTASNSGFCRKILITRYASDLGNAVAPYDKDPTLSLLKVQSQVWWKDKKCPAVNDWPGPGACSIELDTFLTNWKNY
jgi:type II secretory pathway pseudopilin PulG